MKGIFKIVNGAVFYVMTQSGIVDQQLFGIKGVNWSGMETCDYSLHGLWSHRMTWYLDFLKENKFNVIRVPFSQEWVHDQFETATPPTEIISADPSLSHLKSIDILDKLFDEAEKRNIFILLDMHRLPCDAQSHEVWYSLSSPRFTYDTYIRSWQKMIDRYGQRKNLHGIDLLNEPRGLAQWSDDPKYSLNLFYENVNRDLNYTGLIYYEGNDWGRGFSGMKDYPVRNQMKDRTVWSSHQYGPSVVGSMNLDPAILHATWQKDFGYLQERGEAVVIGEFGGRYDGADKIWQTIFVDYLLDLRIPGCYWGLLPNSHDTGGLLADDYTTPLHDKLELLGRLMSNPTVIDLTMIQKRG